MTWAASVGRGVIRRLPLLHRLTPHRVGGGGGLSSADIRASFERDARRYLDMSADDFTAAYLRGDLPDNPVVAHLSMYVASDPT